MVADLCRVLIVDDSIEDRVATKRFLMKANNRDWQFVEASQGEQGLSLAVLDAPFDCILLDYRLPDMDGVEFIERLKSRVGGPGFATVVLAGTGDESVAVRAIKVGAQDYLLKRNLNSERLLYAVDNAISRFRLTLANLHSSQALAESEKRYRGLVEAIPQIVWTVTPTGDLDYVNSNWSKLLGITLEEFNLSGWSPLLPDDDKRQFKSAWDIGLQSGKAFEIEHRLLHHDNTDARWYLSRAIPIQDHAGHLVQWSGTSTDIDDRKKAEFAAINHQKLESIGLLASGIAHDFNNLLVGIVGGASYVASSLPSGHPLQTTLEGIVAAGQSAAHLTSQMLAYAGKGQHFIEVIEINELIRSTCDLVKASIPNQVHLSLRTQPNLPAIEADSGQMQQMIMNLILNAAEATGNTKAAEVNIHTSVVNLDAVATEGRDFASGSLVPGQYVVVEVHDNGCGMDQETRLKIFDPFFTTKFTGRGLGLSAVHGILRAHQGAIELKSKAGEGSTFRVYLPASNENKSITQSALQDTTQRVGTILVVDDEPGVRQIAKTMLEGVGFQIILAQSGEQAIHILMDKATPSIALMVLDMSMPEMNGKEVIQELRVLGIEIPILICSGYSEMAVYREFSGLGIAGFVQKPFTFRQLVAKITQALPALFENQMLWSSRI